MVPIVGTPSLRFPAISCQKALFFGVSSRSVTYVPYYPSTPGSSPQSPTKMEISIGETSRCLQIFINDWLSYAEQFFQYTSDEMMGYISNLPN